MSIKIIEDLRKMPLSLIAHLNDEYYMWAKGIRTEDPLIYQAIQGVVSCKDYVLDTQFRTQGYFDPQHWTKEVLHQNVTIIFFPLITDLKNLQKHLETFLHPLEKKFGFTPTKVLQTVEVCGNKKRKCAVIDGDDQWNRNGLLYSFYLSIIRALAHTDKDKIVTQENIFEICGNCNEYNYWMAVKESKYQVDFINFIWNNIPSLVEIPKEFNSYTGWNHTYHRPSHGETGPFHLAGRIDRTKVNAAIYEQYGYTTPKLLRTSLSNYFAQKFMGDI